MGVPQRKSVRRQAERVRPKQGSSFKRHYFSCLTIFLKYSYSILKLQHLLYLLKKLNNFFMKIDYALLLLKPSGFTSGPCSMQGGRREMYSGFLRGKLKEIDHLEDLSID